jgi:hypothetical protein
VVKVPAKPASGFEFVFAIVGMLIVLIVAFIVKHQRK